MTDPKGLGSKIFGIFVESGESAPPEKDGEDAKTPAEIVAELARGSGPKAKGPGAAPDAQSLPAGLKLDRVMAAPGAAAPTDFNDIFRDAGMDAAELDRVKKAEELLKSLPEATPQAVKKQIVEASLKAFGFEVEKIVLAAENQKRALDAYVRVNESATAKGITDNEAQIRQLNDKVSALQKDIEKRRTTLSTVANAAVGRKADVQKVLDFFHGPDASSDVKK